MKLLQMEHKVSNEPVHLLKAPSWGFFHVATLMKQPTDAHQAIMLELLQAERQVLSQAASVRRHLRLQTLIADQRPNVPSHLRALLRSSPAVRKLQSACEQQASLIVERQIKEACGSAADDMEALSRLNRLLLGEWQLLRGNFPRVYSRVNRLVQDRKVQTHRALSLVETSGKERQA